jgi:hypothetical protein
MRDPVTVTPSTSCAFALVAPIAIIESAIANPRRIVVIVAS